MGIKLISTCVVTSHPAPRKDEQLDPSVQLVLSTHTLNARSLIKNGRQGNYFFLSAFFVKRDIRNHVL